MEGDKTYMNLILIAFKYVIGLLSVMVIYKIIDDKKYYKEWVLLPSTLVYVTGYLLFNKYVPVEFLGDILIVITLGIIIETDWKSKISQLFIVFLLWETIQTIMEVIFNIRYISDRVLCQIFVLLCSLIIYFISKKYKNTFINTFSDKAKLIICVLFFGSSIFMQLLIVFLDVIRVKIDNEYILSISKSIIILAVIGMIINIFLFLYVYCVSVNQKILLEKEKEYRSMQDMYYKIFNQKDEGLRRFKHDIENHLVYLYDKAKQADNYEITSYIQKMNENILANNYNIKNTGDEVINILLNYYLPSLDKNTEIKITGKLSESFCSETFDTNIIIGNIIKNSVEELQKDIVSKKIFEMSIEEGMKFKRIAIMNTIVKYNIKHNSNRRHYGYGIGIVEYYVKKNHGKYEIKKENNKYKIAITIPKK